MGFTVRYSIKLNIGILNVKSANLKVVTNDSRCGNLWYSQTGGTKR